ncbi:MAG: hypothetical protein E7352_07225 [Clostridiales bacterium]|nr:hypothetical protein [Clostridiales bacterium]
MKRMKKILITSMCVAAMGAITAPVMGAIWSGKADDIPTWENITLQEEYLRNDTLTIPDASIAIGGNTYDASIKMKYPNGAVSMVESGDFALTQPGQYTLIYEAQGYTKEVEFLVQDKLWSVGNPNSTVEYGKVGSTNALVVRLAKNDVLSFNRIIDLSTLEAKDALLSGFINPPVAGMYEFDKFVITLTDVTDPTQKLTIRGNRSSTNNQRFASYWTSAGPGQTLGGWDPNANRFATDNPDGIRGRHAQNASFYSQIGWYGSQYPGGCAWEDASPDACAFTISYDINDVKTSINQTWIADHDNGTYYEEEPLWYGFPSNKVFMTVEAQECAGESAGFCISKVFGYDFSEENVFVETEAPEISVDVDEKYVKYENGAYNMIPTAVIGGNYPVPVASAFDNYSGNLKVDTKVYFNYSSETGREQCSIKKDNTFKVDRAGKYTIVYKATDAMGNVVEKLYWINAVKSLENPLTITLGEKETTSGACGEKIAVASYEVTGGSSEADVKITATCGDTVLDVTNGYFIPEETGTWTVSYEAKDFAGVKVTDSYTVEISLGTKPVFVDEVLLPKYIISNIVYYVPTVKAYDYSSGTKVEKIADMVLSDANGDVTYKAGDAFTPVVTEGQESITLTFKSGDAEYKKVIPVVTPVTDANGRKMIDVVKMFVGENFSAEVLRSNGMKVLAQEDGAFNWEFVNAVAAEGSSVTIKGIQGNSKFDALKVTFTDYANENIAVTMNIENQANGFARVNFGDLNRELTKGFNLGKDSNGFDLDTFAFSFKRGKFYVDSLAVGVTTDDNGNAFNGFPSGKVYISVEATNAAADSGYYVKQIDNQIINTNSLDSTQPRIGVSDEYGGMHTLNSTYTVAPAIASDTVDASVTAVVTIRTPDGEIIKDVDGLAMENVPADRYYYIKLTSYGQYKVEYSATDFGNKMGTLSYAINVFDQRLPQAAITGTWSATAKLGDTVVLPEITISDDSSSVEEMKVFRYVFNPHGDAITFGQDFVVTNGKIAYYKYSFTFNNVGKYTFVNVVYDAAGNQRIVEYTVTVEA